MLSKHLQSQRVAFWRAAAQPACPRCLQGRAHHLQVCEQGFVNPCSGTLPNASHGLACTHGPASCRSCKSSAPRLCSSFGALSRGDCIQMAKRKAREAALEQSGSPAKKGAAADGQSVVTEAPFLKSKQKVLVLASRGITFRHRHLLLDFIQLLPHSKKDAKLDTKSDRGVINEVADIKGCNNVLFFEARKHKDLYLWMAKCPDGPSVKFHVTNVHTLAELKLSGNHLKGSRPVLSFHKGFDEQPHLQVLKEMLTHTFAVPKKHNKSKPFFDHVISFAVLDNRIWIRNYQVLSPLDKQKIDLQNLSLVEVGPRCCLNPNKVFAGSFGGPVLYENPAYVSPNLVRRNMKLAKASKYSTKVAARQKRREHMEQHPLPLGEFAGLFKPPAEA